MTSKDQSTNSEDLRQQLRDIADNITRAVLAEGKSGYTREDAVDAIIQIITSHTKSAVIAELEGFQHGGTISQYSIKKRIAEIKADKEAQ